jgi:hypothetical protein
MLSCHLFLISDEDKDQNAGQSHSINTDNISSARVGKFILFGTPLTEQNSI